MAVSTPSAVLLPQVEAAWIHEFADDQRRLKASYRDAEGDSTFTYKSESPDRNFALVGAGLSMVLPNGLQPFVSFRTLLGNENFWSAVASLGLRANF